MTEKPQIQCKSLPNQIREVGKGFSQILKKCSEELCTYTETREIKPAFLRYIFEEFCVVLSMYYICSTRSNCLILQSTSWPSAGPTEQGNCPVV